MKKYKINVKRKDIIDIFLYFHNKKAESYIKLLAKNYNKKECKILELGSGTKSMKKYFPYAKFIATDIIKSEYADEIADIKNLKYKDNQFDLVLCCNVLEHIDLPAKAISECYRTLKKNGCFFIVTPFLFPVHDPPQDYFRYTEFAYKNLLNRFNKIIIDKILIFPFRFSLFNRLVLYYVVRSFK